MLPDAADKLAGASRFCDRRGAWERLRAAGAFAR